MLKKVFNSYLRLNAKQILIFSNHSLLQNSWPRVSYFVTRQEASCELVHTECPAGEQLVPFSCCFCYDSGIKLLPYTLKADAVPDE